MWVADPLSYDFFIHYTSPVLTGAQGAKLCETLCCATAMSVWISMS